MPNFDLDWILNVTSGEAKSRPHQSAECIVPDTRKDLEGGIFIALRGANFDAHDFLAQAVAGKVKMLIVDNMSQVKSEWFDKVSVVLVNDTLKALQDLAEGWRLKLNCRFLAVTGSNGKTTTKEFASKILSTKFITYASPGNFNNHWGVPLSLLSIKENTQVVIIEMGMNKMGEIQRLCEIAHPDTVLVTMVGSAHIGALGSKEQIAKAKNEIYLSCQDCTKIFNIDNEYTIGMYEAFIKSGGGKHFTFSSFNQDADVSLRVEKISLGSILLTGHIGKVSGQCTVFVFGRHNVNNIMGAACMALSCGMTPDEIWQALPLCQSLWGRNQLLELKNGAQVLFDAYNASFDSTVALVKSIYEFDSQGAKVAIIGQMLELGESSPDMHEKLGELVAQTGFDTVWFIGKDKDAFAQGMRGSGFEKNLLLSDTYKETLAKQVGSMLNPSDIAIIKGSRGMRMEQVLDTWRDSNLI